MILLQYYIILLLCFLVVVQLRPDGQLLRKLLPRSKARTTTWGIAGSSSRAASHTLQLYMHAGQSGTARPRSVVKAERVSVGDLVGVLVRNLRNLPEGSSSPRPKAAEKFGRLCGTKSVAPYYLIDLLWSYCVTIWQYYCITLLLYYYTTMLL